MLSDPTVLDDLREWDVTVRAVVITRFDNQPAAVAFKNRLERRGIRVYTHRATKGYPADVDTIVSEEGYGANPYIETERPIVVITGPGPGSGRSSRRPPAHRATPSTARSSTPFCAPPGAGTLCGWSR